MNGKRYMMARRDLWTIR